MAPLTEWVQDLSGSALARTGHRLALSKAWATTVVALGLLLVVNTLVCCILFLKKERLEREIKVNAEVPHLKVALKSLHGMIAAAERIVNHLYPLRGGVPYAVDRASITRTIRANGDTLVKGHYVLRACLEALPCWRINIRAEAEAPHVEFLDGLRFKLIDPKTHKQLSYLVTTDDPHYKQISVFLLPHLNPGEEAREVAYEYAWPKMSQRLLLKGQEQFNLDLRSRDPVGKVDFCLLFDPELQERGLSCGLMSASLEGATLSPVEFEGGLKGWRYSASNVPGDFSFQLEVKAK
jgi:hypothetical protein